MKTKQQKKITLGVCGGIAAYKACELVRLLVKNDFTVRVMMTRAAQQFIAPLTFQTLSNHAVVTDLFHLSQDSHIEHIELADSADIVVIAPATANIMAKVAHGICDDIVSTVVCATKAPVLFVPSMNVNMYNNPITEGNIQRLQKRGYRSIGPGKGELACGWDGEGRMSEPEEILARVRGLSTGRS